MQPIIATLILMVAGRGVAQLITSGQIITIYYAPYDFIGNGFLFGLPFAAVLAVVVIVLLHALLTATPLGLFIRAIGINPLAARIAGVRARPITLCLYGFCGLMAGLAGLIISSNVKSADANNAGTLLELDAILAVTLGGTALTGGRFSLAGTAIGALIIQTLTATIYSLGVPPEVNLVFKAALIFVVMLLQSAEFRASIRALATRPSRTRRDMSALTLPGFDRRLVPLTATLLLFFAMVGFGAAAYDGFFAPQVFLNLAIDNAFLLIAAVGMTFVILTGGIDLSVGSVLAFTTMAAAALIEHAHLSPWLVMPLLLAAGAAFGALQGFLIHRYRLQPFIVTLAGMFVARGLCYLIDTESIPVRDPCSWRWPRCAFRWAAVPCRAAPPSRSSPWRRHCGWRTQRASDARCTPSAATRARRRSWACPWARRSCACTR